MSSSRPFARTTILLAVAVFGCAFLQGCAQPNHRATAEHEASLAAATTQPTTFPAVYAALSAPEWSPELQALVVPPIGWQPSILPAKFNAFHQVWVSPSGRTAYGVIRFTLPLPVPHDPVLWVFLKEMRRKEGQAALLHKRWDPRGRGLRAVIEGGRYTIRVTLTIRGLAGWMTYAGTMRNEPLHPDELHAAETARDQTELGKTPDR